MQMNKRKNTKMELVISDSGITANEKKMMSLIKENERETLEDEERAKKAEKFSILQTRVSHQPKNG